MCRTPSVVCRRAHESHGPSSSGWCEAASSQSVRVTCVYDDGQRRWIPGHFYLVEKHLYSTLPWMAVHPNRFTVMRGGGALGLSSTTTMCSIYLRRLPQYNSASVLTTHQPQVERKESHRAKSSGWGLLGGHDWQGPVAGIWPGHRGYIPTLNKKCQGIFNDHRESGPWFNVSSEGRCFLQYSVPVTILGC